MVVLGEVAATSCLTMPRSRCRYSNRLSSRLLTSRADHSRLKTVKSDVMVILVTEVAVVNSPPTVAFWPKARAPVGRPNGCSTRPTTAPAAAASALVGIGSIQRTLGPSSATDPNCLARRRMQTPIYTAPGITLGSPQQTKTRRVIVPAGSLIFGVGVARPWLSPWLGGRLGRGLGRGLRRGLGRDAVPQPLPRATAVVVLVVLFVLVRSGTGLAVRERRRHRLCHRAAG